MPKNETSSNLVDNIPKDKQEEIVKEIVNHYRLDLISRAAWEEKRNDWYRLWACIRKEKSDPWPNCSNVCVPIMATACNQFHGRAYQSIFSAPGMVKTIPVSENDTERAKSVEHYLNWQTLYEMEEYEEVFDKTLQKLPIFGTHFKKTFWNSDTIRPVSDQVDALDVVLPYGTKSLETARRIAHRVWLYRDELDDRDEQGLYANYDQIPETGGTTQDDTELKNTSDDADGVVRNDEDEKPRLIIECHKKYNLGDGRKPYIITIDHDEQVLLRVTSRLFDGKPLNYFTDYHFLPNPNGFYSFGFGHFLEQFVEMSNTAFNQIFDAGTLSNTPFGFYGRRAGIKAKDLKIRPGLMAEVEDAKNVYFPNIQRVDQVLFQIIGLVQNYVEQFTSTSDYLMGRESKGTKTPTAHGTLAIIEQGLVTFAVITKRVFRQLRKELRLIMALNQINLPAHKQFRIEGKTPIPWAEIKKSDFNGVNDVIPIGDPSYASKSTRRQEAIEKYQLGMMNPLIVGNPQSGIPPNIRAMHALTSEWLDTYEEKNKSDILKDLPEEPIPPEAENAMFMQGDDVQPKIEEDHRNHLQVHMAFKASEYWVGMKDEYKKLHDKHLQDTVRMAYLQQQEMAKLGSQGVQGVPGQPQQGGGNGGNNQGGNTGLGPAGRNPNAVQPNTQAGGGL